MLQHAEGIVRRARRGDAADAEGDPARRHAGAGHAAGSTVAGLLESGQAAALAADPAGLVRDAIEEGLRWVSPIGTQTRRVVVETELGGVTLPVGANLGVLVSSANRDEEVLGPDRRRLRPLPPEAQPRRLRVRPSLLLRPPLLAGADADRDPAALRAAPEPPRRHRPTARLQRLGVPGTAASARALGRLMSAVDLGAADLADGELREVTVRGALARGRPQRRPLRRVRDLVHARGVPARRWVARGRGDPLRLPRLALLARRRRRRSRGRPSIRSRS